MSVRTTGGASDRHWLKACLTNGLTYLLTYLLYQCVLELNITLLAVWLF